MKKILTIATALLLCQTVMFAQKQKEINEKEVPVRYVKDFQKNAPGVESAAWYMIDSLTYEVKFINNSESLQSYLYSPKGTETRYFIESKYYPHAIKDTVANQYPKHNITDVYVRTIKKKSTYQTRISIRKGLFRKRESDIKLLNFETNGKFIDVQDVATK